MKKAREFQKNIYFCFTDYMKVFNYVDQNKLWKILKEMGTPEHLMCPLRNLYVGSKATVTNRHEITTDSKLGKEYNKVVYCHPVYLAYIQSASWEMMGWMNDKLESRLPGEISAASFMQMITNSRK